MYLLGVCKTAQGEGLARVEYSQVYDKREECVEEIKEGNSE